MTTRDELQRNIFEWAKETFGEAAIKPHERARRFLEEALELVQAQGVSKTDVLNLVDYTYGRPVGHVEQEVGGVCVTLLAYCESVSVSAEQAMETEWARVQHIDPAKFRERQAAKAAAGVAAVGDYASTPVSITR